MVSVLSFRCLWRSLLFWGMVLWVLSFFVSVSVGSQDKIFYFGVAVPVFLLLVSGDGKGMPWVIYGVLVLLFLLSVPVFWSGDADYLNLVSRYLRYFFLTSCVFLAPFLLRGHLERLCQSMLWAIIAGAAVAALLQWLKFALVVDFELTSHGVGGVGGIGVNPNVTGAAMGVAFLVSLHVAASLDQGWLRAFCFFFCLLFLSSMSLALARTAFVALFMVLLIQKLPVRQFFVYYLLFFLCCVLLLAASWAVYGLEAVLEYTDRLLAGRVSIWSQLLKDVSGHWWFGLGLQRELEFYTPGLSRPYMTAHNIYLQTLRNGGVFALAALVSLMILIIKNIDSSKGSEPWRSVFIFGLIYALVDAYYYPVSDPNSNWLFLWLPAGYLLMAGIQKNGSREDTFDKGMADKV